MVNQILKILFFLPPLLAGIHKEKAQQVNESSMLMPINVYGKTKLIIEMAIKDLASYYNFKYAIFRFFNVAGADSMLRTGSMSKKYEHIVQNLVSTLLVLLIILRFMEIIIIHVMVLV